MVVYFSRFLSKLVISRCTYSHNCSRKWANIRIIIIKAEIIILHFAGYNYNTYCIKKSRNNNISCMKPSEIIILLHEISRNDDKIFLHERR